MTAWIVPLDVDNGTDANEVNGGSGAVDGPVGAPPGGSAAAALEKTSAIVMPLSTAARSATAGASSGPPFSPHQSGTRSADVS